MNDYREKLRGLMADVLQVDVSRIGAGLKQADLPEWDSFHHMDLVMAIEDAFGVSFTDDEVVKMTAYDEVVSFLGRKIDG